MAVRPQISPLLVAGTLLFALPVCASAQAPQTSLAKERAAAKAAGIELSLSVLSPPMPSASENAALIYEKLDAMSRPKSAAEIMRNINAPQPTPEQKNEQLLETVSRRPDKATGADWLTVRKILEHRAPELAMVREAARRPKCVFGSRELAGDPASGIEDDVAEPARAGMREAARLLLYESIWEAHDHRPNDAIRDLSLEFAIARQSAAKQGTPGYFNTETIYGAGIGGFKAVVRMYTNDPAVCRSARKAIRATWKPIPLSETLKVDTAINQGMLETISKSGPQIIRESKTHQTLADFNQKIDAYRANHLQGMRREIAVVDEPHSQAAPKLQAIYDETVAKNPDRDDFPNTFPNNADMTFHRDSLANAVSVTDAGAAVIIYHAEHGKYPATLAGAMPNAPTDAFDGQPLHYETTAIGFVISATHQRTGHRPEPTIFRYPL